MKTSLNCKQQSEATTTKETFPTKTKKQTLPSRNQDNNSQLKGRRNIQKETRPKSNGRRKQKQKPNESFLPILRAVALQQTKLHMEKEQNRSFNRIDEKELIKSTTIEVITLTSESTQSSALNVYTSDNKFDFMVISPNSPDTPTTLLKKFQLQKYLKQS